MKSFILLACIFAMQFRAISQFVPVYTSEAFDVDGAIEISDSRSLFNRTGTIRFNSTNKQFEGFNGMYWIPLGRLSTPGSGVTDIEGRTYHTVILGQKEWMAENLSTSKYNDGSDIPKVEGLSVWRSLVNIGAWCYYDNNSNYNQSLGKLYNWYAIDSDKLCPSGWKVPSQPDYIELNEYLGGRQISGAKLKEVGLSSWYTPNLGATNESGFNAKAGGQRNSLGIFEHKDFEANFWTSSDSVLANQVFYAILTFNSKFGGINPIPLENKKRGMSVRCVRR